MVPQEYLALCAGLAVKNGMREFDALKAITINAAKHIGVSNLVGSIQTGKDADFVLTKGAPMVPDTKLAFVIIDGIVRYSEKQS